MSTRFCPKCALPQAMNVSSISREETDANGETRSIETTSYHCARCFSFIASEDRLISAEQVA